MLTMLNNDLLEDKYEEDNRLRWPLRWWQHKKDNSSQFEEIEEQFFKMSDVFEVGGEWDNNEFEVYRTLRGSRGKWVVVSEAYDLIHAYEAYTEACENGEDVNKNSWEKYLHYDKSSAEFAAEFLYFKDRRAFWKEANLSHGLGASVLKDPTPQPEVIRGVLRKSHKMLLTGASKAGKSFLLMELATAMAYNKPWLGFTCQQGRVLYINLEIDPVSCQNRFFAVGKALQLSEKEREANKENLVVWNMRGQLETVESLCDKVSWFITLYKNFKEQQFDMVIIDPLYMIIDGNENDAGDIKRTFNYLEAIAARTECAVVACHHHSKGAAGGKRVIDRASGSGVFARAVDAFMDITELDLTEEGKAAAVGKYATGWRVETVARDFPPLKPLNIWFNYPVHVIDETGALEKQGEEGSRQARLAKSPKRKAGENREARFAEAFQKAIDGKKFAEGETPSATIAEIVKHYGTTAQNVRNVVRDLCKEYCYENKQVWRISDAKQSKTKSGAKARKSTRGKALKE